MEPSSWQAMAWILIMGTGCGLAFWVLARIALYASRAWRGKLPFGSDILAESGERHQRWHRELGREAAALAAGMLVVVVTSAFAWLLLPYLALPTMPAWVLVAAMVVAIAVLGAGGYLLFRAMQKRRRARFEWAARVAIGNVLKRLNFSGNRVLHEVPVEGSVIDHVVVGAKGVFALNVVAKPARTTEGRPTAELRNGKLAMGGEIEALPVGDAARNMTLLTAALTKVVGHRVPVRSVLVVPGWHCLPNGEGNHLLLNDGNLAMLTSWNRPDAYLMDEDCVAIQKFLQDACRIKTMS